MTTPTTIQIANRIQVNAVRLNISHRHAATDASGTNGDHGTRKPRRRSGRVRRSTTIPAETKTNANSVPTLTISSSLAIGNTEAATATSSATRTVIRTEVPRGPVVANGRGNNPSRDIANSTRH